MPRIRTVVARLLARGGPFTSSEVAAKASVSRQSAHALLAAMVARGELAREGLGRAVRYRAPGPVVFTLRKRLPGLEEDRVWQEVVERLPGLPPRARTILQYAFTELLNNAIDHSGGKSAAIRVEDGPVMAFEIVDRGIGAFENVRQGLHLRDAMEAAQELSKGKVTTQPKRHTGEGLFFTSHIADALVLEGNGLRLLVDGLRDEWALGPAPRAAGTRVRFEIARDTRKELAPLFDRYTTALAFDRTQIRIKLFELGVRFVSRSEAKRLLRGLERFREAVLDFGKVELVGQGFADEVFRVWAAEHPGTLLVPQRMSAEVAFLVGRAQAAAN